MKEPAIRRNLTAFELPKKACSPSRGTAALKMNYTMSQKRILHGIRLSGPALGKPPKNQNLSRLAKKQEYQDSCDRNAVEGVFGTGKTAYGLARIMVRLRETTCCVIGVALLLLNLTRSLRATLCFFICWLPQLFYRGCGVDPT